MINTLRPNLNISALTHIPDSIDELSGRGLSSHSPSPHIQSNLIETLDALYLQIAVPGIDVSTLNIQTVARKVVIQGKYRIAVVEGAHYLRHDLPTGGVYHSFQLPVEVDGDRADASDKDGILTVRLPKVAHLWHSIPVHAE